jgi:transposase
VGAAESPSARALLTLLKSLLLAMMAMLDELRATLAARDAELAELRTALFGQRSERRRAGSTPSKPALSPEELEARRAAAQAKRDAKRAAKAELPTEDADHPAPPTCPACSGAGPFSPLPPEVSYQLELVPARLKRIRHIQHKAVCPCGQILCGPAPVRVGDCAQYGPHFHADAVVSKCADALPLHRLARRYARAGFDVARSTLTDVFHRSAGLLEPLYKRLLAIVAAASHVNADETPQPVMDHERCRTGFIWTFIAGPVIAYVFSASRSGETPARVLGASVGSLQVDGYTGYNVVTTPERRTRAGCLAHARRYFYAARDTCPDEAAEALALIRDLYRVEYDAASQGLLGTQAHRALRHERSRPITERWYTWLTEQQPKHVPKSPLGKAITYALNQWDCLTRFLDDPRLSLDNNVSERSLRVIALGRHAFRWVGHDIAGENFAVLQTLVATCAACGVNPHEYIADVLVRVATHPASALDELLPMNWRPLA